MKQTVTVSTVEISATAHFRAAPLLSVRRMKNWLSRSRTPLALPSHATSNGSKNKSPPESEDEVTPEFKRGVAHGIAMEREACALLCESIPAHEETMAYAVLRRAAAAIRGRDVTG